MSRNLQCHSELCTRLKNFSSNNNYIGLNILDIFKKHSWKKPFVVFKELRVLEESELIILTNKFERIHIDSHKDKVCNSYESPQILTGIKVDSLNHQLLTLQTALLQTTEMSVRTVINVTEWILKHWEILQSFKFVIHCNLLLAIF